MVPSGYGSVQQKNLFMFRIEYIAQKHNPMRFVAAIIFSVGALKNYECSI